MRYLIAPLFIFAFSVQSFAFRANTKDSSTMNECLWNKAALSTDVDCSDLYHHYLPKKSSYKPKANVRLGSYNILRTSEQKAKKNLDLTSEMINSEWDIVSLSELQPGRTDDVKKGNRPGAQYILPAYIELLLKLQEKDSSWGMMVSPYSQGSDSEILGFLYRGNQAKPIESKYCKTNYMDEPPYTSNFVYRELSKTGIQTSKDGQPINDRDYVLPKKAMACPLALSGLRSKYFIKVPLTARFQSGDFKFSYISLHLSFRGIEEFDNNCMGTCQLQNLQIISSLNGFESSQAGDDDYNPILVAINEFRSKPDTIRIIEGTENKIPPTKSRCSKTKAGFADCKARLAKLLSYIKKRGFLPKSCENIVKNVEDEAKYKACEKDYISMRRDGYNEMVKDVFSKIVEKELANDDGRFSGIVSEMYSILGEDKVISKGEGRKFARFYQVYSVLKEAGSIKEMENSEDVVVAGDFNLPVEENQLGWKYKMWEHAMTLLPGSQLYITGKTSLNKHRQLANNYDHFILSPSETNECDADAAYILNYLTDTLSNGFDLGQAVQDIEYNFVMSDHLPIGMNCTAK